MRKKDRNAISSLEFLSFSFSSSSDRSFEVTKKANIVILNMSSFCHTVCRLLTIWTEYYVCACQNLKIIFYLFLNSLDFYHCQSIIGRFVIKITKNNIISTGNDVRSAKKIWIDLMLKCNIV